MFEKIYLGLFLICFLYSTDFKQKYIYEEPFLELLLAVAGMALPR